MSVRLQEMAPRRLIVVSQYIDEVGGINYDKAEAIESRTKHAHAGVNPQQ